jgi:hypothetical protein
MILKPLFQQTERCKSRNSGKMLTILNSLLVNTIFITGSTHNPQMQLSCANCSTRVVCEHEAACCYVIHVFMHPLNLQVQRSDVLWPLFSSFLSLCIVVSCEGARINTAVTAIILFCCALRSATAQPSVAYLVR